MKIDSLGSFYLTNGTVLLECIMMKRSYRGDMQVKGTVMMDEGEMFFLIRNSYPHFYVIPDKKWRVY